MKRSTWYVIILLIVLIIAVVVCVKALGPLGNSGEPSDTPEPTTPVTEAPTTPEPPAATPAETPEITEPPVFVTKEPVVTPEVSEEPSPEPSHEVAASGSFASDTGTYLNILVEWNAYTAADGAAKLQIDVSATSYSFYTSALYNSIAISVGGETHYMNSPEISYDGSDFATTPLASYTLDAPSGNVELSVVWNYKGSYGGTELDTISASGSAYIG